MHSRWPTNSQQGRDLLRYPGPHPAPSGIWPRCRRRPLQPARQYHLRPGQRRLGKTPQRSFGRILQENTTVSTNSRDNTTSESRQLDLAVPASKIANLSSGEFVGITADSPSQPLRLKGFHAKFVIDDAALKKEEAAWQSLPEIRTVTPEQVQYNFNRIKQEVSTLVEGRLEEMRKNSDLARLILQPNRNSLGKIQAPH